MHYTRDTNSHVENWFRTVKHTIFHNRRYRFKEFIDVLYSAVDARLYERDSVLNTMLELKCIENSSKLNLVRKSKVNSKVSKQVKLVRKLEDTCSSLVQENWSKKRCVGNVNIKKKVHCTMLPLERLSQV